MASTWQPYVDNNMVGTGKLTEAMILGVSDGAIWASTTTLKNSVTPAEIKSLLAAFQDVTTVRSEGLFVGGKKYVVIGGGDGRSLYAKKGDEGVVAVKTKQTVLLGVYAPPAVPGEAVKVVEALADYLISVNF